jgi:hypothetical protein
LKGISEDLNQGYHLIFKGPSNMFSAKIGSALYGDHFALITSVDEKNVGFANPGSKNNPTPK